MTSDLDHSDTAARPEWAEISGAELEAQLERARALAVRLEQENAELARLVELAKRTLRVQALSVQVASSLLNAAAKDRP